MTGGWVGRGWVGRRRGRGDGCCLTCVKVVDYNYRMNMNFYGIFASNTQPGVVPAYAGKNT